MQLAKQVGFQRCLNAVAAGTTPQNGSTVDMSNFDGVLFIALLGALTATQVTLLKAQQGAASNGSDAADIAGATTSALADADSNKVVVLDVYRPTARYVRPVVSRGTANAVIDGVIAIPYHGDKIPQSTLDTTVKEVIAALGV